jgi:hypothetical protein
MNPRTCRGPVSPTSTQTWPLLRSSLSQTRPVAAWRRRRSAPCAPAHAPGGRRGRAWPAVAILSSSSVRRVACHGTMPPHDGLRVRRRARAPGRGPLAQLQHQLAHRSSALSTVISMSCWNSGLSAQALGVLQHQRELGDDVLEVVHHKGRHAVEGIELAHLEQASVACICARKLAAWRPAVLSRSSTSQFTSMGVRGGQHHEADHVVAHRSGTTSQGWASPAARSAAPAAIARGAERYSSRSTTQPLLAQELAERRIGSSSGTRTGAACSSGRCRVDVGAGRLSHRLPPGHSSMLARPRTTMPPVSCGEFGRQGGREAQPLFAVVVAVAEEVLAQEHRSPRPQRADTASTTRTTRPRTPAQLQCPPPVAAEVAHVVADAGHEHQVEPGHHQRGRIEGGVRETCIA